MPYVGSTANIPPKWALCNGSNGTPNLTGRFLEGVTSASAAKISKAAGLPNITGYAVGVTIGVHSTPTGGAFYHNSDENVGGYSSDMDNPTLRFDASRCSSVYGKSTTVQPASYTVMYIMKIKT